MQTKLLKTEDIHPPQTGISAKASYNTSGCLHNESIPKFFLSFTYFGAPDKPCGVGRADANPKLLLNDT